MILCAREHHTRIRIKYFLNTIERNDVDKEASRNVLKAVLQEHPELLNELVPDRESELKVIVTTIRTTEALMKQIDALVRKLNGTKHLKYRGKLSRSDVIRGALERGVAELEKLV